MHNNSMSLLALKEIAKNGFFTAKVFNYMVNGMHTCSIPLKPSKPVQKPPFCDGGTCLCGSDKCLHFAISFTLN